MKGVCTVRFREKKMQFEKETNLLDGVSPKRSGNESAHRCANVRVFNHGSPKCAHLRAHLHRLCFKGGSLTYISNPDVNVALMGAQV